MRKKFHSGFLTYSLCGSFYTCLNLSSFGSKIFFLSLPTLYSPYMSQGPDFSTLKSTFPAEKTYAQTLLFRHTFEFSYQSLCRSSNRLCINCNLFRQVFYIHLLTRSEEHTSELQSRENIVCRLLLY